MARLPTVRDRILAHLASFPQYEMGHQVPFQVSQIGIADAIGIKQRHLSQNIRPMIAEGLVLERSCYVEGGRQHQKVYFLTEQGRKEAAWMRKDELQSSAVSA